jgi:protein O-mannosyl-transferase
MAKRAPNKKTNPVRKQEAEAQSAPPNLNFDRWLPWLAVAAGAVIFLSGISNQMVSMDDHSATVNNEAVRNFPAGIFGKFNLGMYAPLTWFGYAIAYGIGGKNPVWYHLLSLIVHTVNILLVFRVFTQLTRQRMEAFIIALFFAIHPMQVEPVAWIAGFSTPLFSLFYLLALHYYVRQTERAAWSTPYWLALALMLPACLAKSAAVTLPLTLLAIDFWQKRDFDRRLVLEKIPFFAIALGFGLLTLYSRTQSGHTIAPATAAFTLPDRFLMACHTILFYWTKILVPVNLSIWYPFQKTAGVWPWTYYTAPVALAAILFGAWRLRHSFRVLPAGILFYLSNIILALPYYTIGEFELRSDRYNYLACLGIFAILAALPVAFQRTRPALAGFSRVLLVGLGIFWFVTAFLRIRDWSDTPTLLNKAVASSGDNFGKAYLWLGMAYGDQGKGKESFENFNKAIARDSNLIEAYKYRGAIFGIAKQYAKSIPDLTKYLSKKPNDYETLFNRALSYARLQRQSEAMADLDKVIAIKPDFAPAYRSRSELWKLMGEDAKAAADFEKFTSLGGK